MFGSKSLVEKCKKGNRVALREFYERHRRSVYFSVLRYARNEEDAKDMLQEAFIQIFKDLHQFDPRRAAVNTWMNRVAINTAIRFNRKNYSSAFKRVDVEVIEVIPEIEEDDGTIYSSKDILAVLQQLPDGYRTVFNLYVVEGYTHKEIAEYLGVSISTSKSQLSKAKGMMRGFLLKAKRIKITALL